MSATEGVVALFDLFGSAAFGVVQSDMNGNIAVRRPNSPQKIRTRLLETGPEKSGTLELLVQNEGKPGEKKRTATEGLLWLLRYVHASHAAAWNSHPKRSAAHSTTPARN